MSWEMSWTGKETSNEEQHKARGSPSCRIVYMVSSRNIRFVVKLNTQQYFPALVSLGMFYESDKRTEAEIRHPPQYRSPLTSERGKIPSISNPFLSYLPSMLRIHISSSSKKWLGHPRVSMSLNPSQGTCQTRQWVMQSTRDSSQKNIIS